MEGPDQWGVYLSSTDTKATVEKAIASGGSLRVGPMDIADLGTEAIIADSAGVPIGAWQANQFPGLAAFDQVGSAVWFQLLTSDYAGAVPFYENVFGWQTRVQSDTPEFRDTVLTADGEDFAGIAAASDGDLAAGEPGRWQVYFRVADVDSALRGIEPAGRDRAAGGGRHPVRAARGGGRPDGRPLQSRGLTGGAVGTRVARFSALSS